MPRLSKIGAAALAAFGWTGLQSVTVSYLVVAGGGGGGFNGGGGGGAGGYRTGTESLNPSLSYTVTVGAGGAPSAADNVVATSGSNSVFSTITSAGGGGGVGNNSGGTTNGAAGGSGGGGGAFSSGGAGNTPSTSPSQGNNGGTGGDSGGTNYGAGGGGGASAVGGNRAGSAGGAGGAGTASSITGTSVTYAGGGGGCGGVTAGAGGAGGGGAGGTNSTVGTSGTANLGGGAGGGGSGLAGGRGGSGIVIISYAGAQQFGGGVVTSVGGNTIHTFTTSGTLSPITPLIASYLIVAGGAGGGTDRGGGGGAGGLLSGSGLLLDTNSIYAVTVGAGGAGGTGSTGSSVAAGNGTNSVFLSYSAVGGGGGGTTALNPGTGFGTGIAGGSGGGGTGTGSTGVAGGAGTSGQGNAGGTGYSDGSGYYSTAGGGGAGAVGVNGSSGGAGAGGVGVSSSISGTATYYAGGGGGSADNRSFTAAGAGGNGGGGAGGAINANGNPATANTGGGGGGGSGGVPVYVGGNGGSGVVIISYAGATQQMAGGTVTIVGGNVIHTFTSSGYLTPIKLVNNSLRFRSSASAYLNRTPTTTGSTQRLTFSLWVKRGSLASYQNFGLNSSATSGRDAIRFSNNDNLEVYLNEANDAYLATTQVFRDPAAWYHIVVAVDTTQATSSNRIKIYVNGVQVTAFGTANYPSQNYNFTGWNVSGKQQNIGRSPEPAYYFDGYQTEINCIDGQQLTPNSFGTFNSYGVWQPITYGGSYGTNGFYLPFTNNASTTTLGYDFSPNGNNWTTNNISVTAGVTYDSMTDVPTLTSATAANYPTLNPLNSYSAGLSNANLKFADGSGNAYQAYATMVNPDIAASSFYCEVTVSESYGIGIAPATKQGSNSTSDRTGFLAYYSNGNKFNGSSSSAYGATFTSGDVIGIAMGGGAVTFYKNGVSQGVAFSSLTGAYMFGTWAVGAAGNGVQFNFGQQPFTYTPPSGFVALNTFNL